MPPEPPVGSTVVDFGASHWTRQAGDDPHPWLCVLDGPGGGMPGDRLSWTELINYGQVRLLGPPIEAP